MQSAASRPQESDDRFEQCRLTGAVGANEGDRFARAHRQRDVLERGNLTVGHVQAFDVQKLVHDGPASASSGTSPSSPRYASIPAGSRRTFSGKPDAITLPRSRQIRRSASAARNTRLCSTTTTVMPSAPNV